MPDGEAATKLGFLITHFNGDAVIRYNFILRGKS